MSDENSQRVDKLEMHLAHLEHQVEQLNGVIIDQGKLLDRLKKEIQRQSNIMEMLELERMKSNNQGRRTISDVSEAECICKKLS